MITPPLSHKFIDETLKKAGASRKSRAIFRAIYRVASGIARVQGLDGKKIFSQAFKIQRGNVQGDVISPVLFILDLDVLLQQCDTSGGRGMKIGRILRIRTLGYVDDVALITPTVEGMSKRLTNIGDASKSEADMDINMSKTFSQHIFKRTKKI